MGSIGAKKSGSGISATSQVNRLQEIKNNLEQGTIGVGTSEGTLRQLSEIDNQLAFYDWYNNKISELQRDYQSSQDREERRNLMSQMDIMRGDVLNERGNISSTGIIPDSVREEYERATGKKLSEREWNMIKNSQRKIR